MKIICLYSYLLLCVSIAKAQEPAHGSYITNNTMTAFHGNWVWNNGSDTVKIYLTTKKIYNNAEQCYVDMLIGWHLYKRGAFVIESSYANMNIVGTETISLWNDNTQGNPRVQGTIKDINKGGKINMLYLLHNNAQTEVVWRCTEATGRIYTKEQDLPQQGVTLPRNMIFRKQ